MILIWIAIFIVALVLLVKGADILLHASERIGKTLAFSPFVIGVLIVVSPVKMKAKKLFSHQILSLEASTGHLNSAKSNSSTLKVLNIPLSAIKS